MELSTNFRYLDSIKKIKIIEYKYLQIFNFKNSVKILLLIKYYHKIGNYYYNTF